MSDRYLEKIENVLDDLTHKNFITYNLLSIEIYNVIILTHLAGSRWLILNKLMVDTLDPLFLFDIEQSL